MTPDRWQATNWTPENPLAIGFSVIDELPYGRHPLTRGFEQRLGWLMQQREYAHQGYGFRLFVTLVEAPRLADRSQWRIHISSTPDFLALAVTQRELTVAFARRLAELVVSWQEVEDVEATLVT